MIVVISLKFLSVSIFKFPKILEKEAGWLDSISVNFFTNLNELYFTYETLYMLLIQIVLCFFYVDQCPEKVYDEILILIIITIIFRGRVSENIRLFDYQAGCSIKGVAFICRAVVFSASWEILSKSYKS